jgi:uncharacterized protein
MKVRQRLIEAAETPERESLVGSFFPDGYRLLGQRLGTALLRQRLIEQTHHVAGASHQEDFFRWIDRIVDFDRLVAGVVRLTGFHGQGYRNFLDIRVIESRLNHPRLPLALDGFRILQLSDIHLDLDSRITSAIQRKLEGLQYDLAVITGDFRNTTDSDHELSVRETLNLIPSLGRPLFGVLGNHDFIEIVLPLEEAGLRFLLNEVSIINHNGAELYLAGVDDPHFYKTHDLARVREAIPDHAFSILLCHSPETYRQAAAHGFDIMLSGHTHGGQICLPGGIALIKVCKVPRRLLRGPWIFRNLAGYTSPGTGSCGVPLRFFCPPEITIHTLSRPP